MKIKRLWALVIVGAIAVSSAGASTVIGLSVEDQARLSKVVAVGEVVSLQGVDDPVNGIETAVTMRVSHAFKGEVRPGETLVFRTRGGEVDGVISEAIGEAEMRVGQTALVFVEEIEGRLYNLGLSSGVWRLAEVGARGRPAFVRALTDGLEVFGDVAFEMGPLPWSDMAARIAYASTHPAFDHPMLREARLGGR